ncbi:MAG: hypothetical protein DCC49_02165 [Acidobacteria bacterium]|nr:MAG: hypothetical protein DCC49_02165 [Acidobacteriota bacterium]
MSHHYENMPRCAFFIAGQDGRPAGTAFALAASDTSPIFVATARHVVRGCAPSPNDYTDLVMNSTAGEEFRIPICRAAWIEHETEDVAVTCLDRDDVEDTASFTYFYLDDRIGKKWQEDFPLLGYRVITVGLFSEAPGKGVVRPVLRFGAVARLNDERHLLRSADGTDQGDFDSYIVDVTSTPGFSGAPVFLDSNVPCVLGVLLGHWNISAPDGKTGSHHSGLALVSPTRYAAEVIDRWEPSG